MCYELIHRCKYCNRDYECDKPLLLCPTINYDTDKNMCDDCRLRLEYELQEQKNLELADFLRSKRDGKI